MSNPPQTQTDIPEIYIEQVKQALENLYDFRALQGSPLAQALESDAPDAATPGAHRLRRRLIEALETLNPGRDVAAHSGIARIYNLLYQHYVGGMTFQEAALEAGISLRQAYRDLRRGLESISAILWYSQESPAQPPEPARLSSVQSEMTRLEGSMTAASLQEMLESALRAVQALAAQRQVALDSHIPGSHVLITTSPTIARQVLTYLLSQIIQQITPPRLRVGMEEHSGSVQFVLSYPASGLMKPRLDPIIEQMMNQIRWKMQYRTGGGELHMMIRSVQEGALLLLIDDNESLVDLLEHYFTGNTYRVISVHNGEDGLRMAQQFLPDAIVLDLMMPGMDGWEVLQRLRTHSDTRDIPVVICSVINDPELAYSLGASRFVPKPITREALLMALRDLNP